MDKGDSHVTRDYLLYWHVLVDRGVGHIDGSGKKKWAEVVG